MRLVWQSFGEAWTALKRNWVVVWFPLLIGLGIIIALTIVFVVMALSTGAGQDWQQLQAGDFATFSHLFIGLGVVILIGFASIMALVAGQANMHARASAGEKVSTEDFAIGVRRFYWRLLGGGLLLSAIGIVFSVIFFGGLFRQLVMYLSEQGPEIDSGSVLPWLIQTVPMALAGFLLLAVAGLFVGMWIKLVTVDDRGAISAILGSIRLVVSKFGPFLVMAIINWVATLLIQRIGEGRGLLSLAAVLDLIWPSYYSLTLFVFYRHITGSNPEPPEVPTQV